MGFDRAPWMQTCPPSPASLPAPVLTEGSAGSGEGSVASPSQPCTQAPHQKAGNKTTAEHFKAKQINPWLLGESSYQKYN